VKSLENEPGDDVIGILTDIVKDCEDATIDLSDPQSMAAFLAARLGERGVGLVMMRPGLPGELLIPGARHGWLRDRGQPEGGELYTLWLKNFPRARVVLRPDGGFEAEVDGRILRAGDREAIMELAEEAADR
jgi:hypothetical protein